MTKEQAKAKAIQDAYGEHWGKVKDHVDKNGWYPGSKMAPLQIGFSQDEVQWRHKFSTLWRPISLRGIEDNNGWIRIESEDDLPKEDGSYQVIIKGAYSYRQYTDYYLYEAEEHANTQVEQDKMWVDNFSHWRHIPPPIPNPIY